MAKEKHTTNHRPLHKLGLKIHFYQSTVLDSVNKDYNYPKFMFACFDFHSMMNLKYPFYLGNYITCFYPTGKEWIAPEDNSYHKRIILLLWG